MKQTKEKTLREKLEKIIFDWIPCDNNRMKRQPDENKINLVLDLFESQKQEMVEEIEGIVREVKGANESNGRYNACNEILDLLKQKLTK